MSRPAKPGVYLNAINKAFSHLSEEHRKKIEERDFEKIQEICNDLKERFPDSELPLLYYAVFFLIPKKKYAEAENVLEKARALNENSSEVLYHIGTIYEHRRSYDKTVEYLDKAIKIDPNPPKYFLKLSVAKWYLWEQSDKSTFDLIKEAISHCEYALSNSDWSDKSKDLYVSVLNSLVFYYNILNDKESLLKAARNVCYLEGIEKLSEFPNRGYYWDSIAVFYLSIYKKKYEFRVDSKDCTNSQLVSIDKHCVDYLFTAKKYFRMAIKEGNLDLAENVGEDLDIYERYKEVLAIIDELEKPSTQ